jgi:hypothetical protein
VETYQVLGLVGSLLLVVAIIIPLTFAPYGMYGGTGYPMMGMMGGYYGHPLVFPILYIGIPAILLGLVGSLVQDRTAAGILLILAGVLSIPILFGFFGISLVLLILAGVLALSKR